MLGAHLVAALSRRHNVVGVDRHLWWGDLPANMLFGDLTTPGFIADTVAAVSPDVLIHCAAMVDVDACERNPIVAYTCNTDVTRNLARAVRADCLFVYITTDGIFKGETPFATEEQLPCPRTVYGRSKLQGEWEVQLSTKNHLIVRTNFYGWSSGRKQTAAEWLYHALDSGHRITLFEDFFFTPIYVVDFVERLMVLIECEHRGIFHVSGKDRISKGEFGRLMAAAANLSLKNVRWGSIDAAALVAPRPKDMSLSSERFRRATGIDVPGCLAGLERFVADRQRALSARFERSKAHRLTEIEVLDAENG